MEDDAIWMALPVPVIVVSGEGQTILSCNTAAEGFFGQSVKTMEGQSLEKVLALPEPIRRPLGVAIRSNAPLSVNDVSVTRNGGPDVACNISAAPFSAEQMLLIVSPRDIGTQAHAAAAHRKAAKSAIGMAEMLAHEIKNPLAGITGAAQLLAMGLSPQDQELTDLIVTESHRIVHLLDQVEQFGNLAPPVLNAVNLHDVLDRARKSAAVSYGTNVNFVENYDPSLPMAAADPDQLLQVFMNLIKNACEAAPNGTITLRSYFDAGLRIRRSADETAQLPLHIEVIDDGPGIAPDMIDHLFDPFVSGRENGTGLGLALVAKLINEMGGWVHVESKPNRTVFRISLPRKK